MKFFRTQAVVGRSSLLDAFRLRSWTSVRAHVLAPPLDDTHLRSLLIVNQQRADVRDQIISVGSAATCAKTWCVDSGSIAPVVMSFR